MLEGQMKPLDGVKVLDLTRVLAGPFATMILGDLGAEVIKVERPGSGDDTRAWGPPFVGEESAYFLSVNRNKKSIAVNLKDPNGAKLVTELAKVCDILVENYLPGKLNEMGLGYEDLREVAPQLIYCSISGYGQTGPESHKPGYDSIASAVSGMMHITGPEDGDPVRPGLAMTDLATGLYTHGAVMAALLQRQRTGRGLHIDCNLLSSQVACLTHIAANYLNAGKEARRWGTAHESIVPYQIFKDGISKVRARAVEWRRGLICIFTILHILNEGFKTKDGFMIVAAGNNQQFMKVCKVLSLNDLADSPKYKSNTLRVEHRKELLQILSERFMEETTREWLRRFEGTGVPCGSINNIQQVFSSSQVAHNGLILEVDHPTSGRIAVPGPAVRFSSFEYSQAMPPPVIGQHTVQVLRGTLGYSDDVINQLLASRTVTQNDVQ
ncbi:succinate--hydroxymethylglutarate CoA-transferase isoform X3 [Triplophysa dalaica]|uniref:succinate--hydroxymethylglutarate CoA-transferase isoform X3 n=1 Tax=Triplophysa dalaica TaxID=1582913 RepID=UPI0024DF6F71|nr:succinate--hydroxymethylglutarate CoA-transferase isoform X3 [Triplophysa dalaica]XP_056593774.1 succinate--hydroxymethylglutarate CoA-transferase isoform X3 [Triplophysa dalaica]